MADSSLSQEILHAEIEMVQLYQKTTGLHQLTRPEQVQLLEQLSQARERCDALLERSMGSDRQRVASLKNRIDEAYQTVTQPLLNGIEETTLTTPVTPTSTEEEALSAKHSSISDYVVVEPNAATESLVTPDPQQGVNGATDTPIHATVREPTDTTASTHPQYDAPRRDLRIEELIMTAPDMHIEEEGSGKRATMAFCRGVKDFFLSQILVAGIFWVAVFLFIAALKPSAIHAIVNWIAK